MTRRERALKRVERELPATKTVLSTMEQDMLWRGITAYEAERAADLESEKTADRALKAQELEWIGAYDHERGLVDGMRAALRTVLEGAA